MSKEYDEVEVAQTNLKQVTTFLCLHNVSLPTLTQIVTETYKKVNGRFINANQ